MTLRSSFVVLLLLTTSIVAFTQTAPLDLAARANYQRAIEEVYWQSRVWPDQNVQSKPLLDQVVTSDQLLAKAEDGVRLSSALVSLWRSSITSNQLQAEMVRMAQDTKQPQVLRGLFAALGNDPRVIAETLARPVLAERLARNFYNHDVRFDAKKQPFEIWWQANRTNYAPQISEPAFAYALPEISDASTAADTWVPTHALPDANIGMTAVWTGVEMIIWGGGTTLAPVYTGSRYNPATDTWHSTNNSAITVGKTGHTAVWTGTEMIVWGGCDLFRGEHTCDSADGMRYNPASDTWTPTRLQGAPHTRMNHTAVWTGSEMIVFGGCSFINDVCRASRVKDGGRYNPTTDTWTPTNTANAPGFRSLHTAVWTGTQMIVWGGFNDTAALSTGGVYTPASDTWTATAPVAANLGRYFHTAVWTGSEMIMWGGTNGTTTLNNGARYNPSTNTWRVVTTNGAPSARSQHTTVWSGTEMIVWGGVNGFTGTNTGGRYNPATNSWKPTSVVNAPVARRGTPVSVWTGSQMIAWGGFNSSGGRYDPAADAWTPTNGVMTPTGRDHHTAVWTGTEMVVWGGVDANIVGGTNTGSRYNLALDTWRPTTTNGAPSGREFHSAIWTGTEMIIWGGQSGNIPFKNGARYNPVTDMWKRTATIGAPPPRSVHSTVWTGAEMIVWGGSGVSSPWLNNGGRYNPSTDSWTQVTNTGAPVGRELHSAVWTGTEMVVWGGATSTFDTNTGGRYNPATDSWRPTSIVNAPAARNWAAYTWTGSKVLIWGGQTYNGSYVYHQDGAQYDPNSDTWTPTSLINAPSGRGWFPYVWTGSELIVWAGCETQGTFCTGDTVTGARYNPASDLWRPIGIASAPSARDTLPAVWTGSQMIVWGGHDWSKFFLDTTGGVFTPGP